MKLVKIIRRVRENEIGPLFGQFCYKFLGFNPIPFLYISTVYQCIWAHISALFMYRWLPNTCTSLQPCIFSFLTCNIDVYWIYIMYTSRIQPFLRPLGPKNSISSLAAFPTPVHQPLTRNRGWLKRGSGFGPLRPDRYAKRERAKSNRLTRQQGVQGKKARVSNLTKKIKYMINFKSRY